MCVFVCERVHRKQDSCLGGPPIGDMMVYPETTTDGGKMISPMKTIFTCLYIVFRPFAFVHYNVIREARIHFRIIYIGIVRKADRLLRTRITL